MAVKTIPAGALQEIRSLVVGLQTGARYIGKMPDRYMVIVKSINRLLDMPELRDYPTLINNLVKAGHACINVIHASNAGDMAEWKQNAQYAASVMSDTYRLMIALRKSGKTIELAVLKSYRRIKAGSQARAYFINAMRTAVMMRKQYEQKRPVDTAFGAHYLLSELKDTLRTALNLTGDDDLVWGYPNYSALLLSAGGSVGFADKGDYSTAIAWINDYIKKSNFILGRSPKP